MKQKKIIILAVVVLFIGLIYKNVFVPKHTFEVVNAQKGNMNVIVNGVGNIGAKNIYKIGSVYGGKILEFNINEGDFIKQNRLIAKIDYIDLKDKIIELEQTNNKIQSDIKSLQVDKQSAIVEYKLQQEIFKKNEKLFTKRAISELDFKKFQTNKDVARLKIASIGSKINSLKAQSGQIQASINGLKQKLARYNIFAPVSGYVTKKYVTNYQIINPNQALIEIVNPKDVWVKTYIDTRKSGNIKINDKAVIKLRSGGKEYKGYVANIKPINNPVTYEREVDVKFKNLPIPFYLEEQAIVDIKTKNLNNITKIPNRALTIYNEKTGIWIVKDSQVQFKSIKILTRCDKFFATNDIEANTKIVIPNPKNKPLFNGMKIFTKEVK